MAERNVFVSPPAASATDVAWAHEFADALRAHGWAVFEDRNDARRVPLADVETALRGSDLVVLLLDDANASMPTFFFYLGAAAELGKPIVAVVPPSNGTARVAVPLPEERRVVKTAPRATADEIVSRVPEPLPA